MKNVFAACLLFLFASSASSQEVNDLDRTLDAIEAHAAKLHSDILEELGREEANPERAAELIRFGRDAVRIRLEIRKAKQQLRLLEMEMVREERVDTYGEMLDISESPMTFQDKACAGAGEGAVNGRRYVNGKCQER